MNYEKEKLRKQFHLPLYQKESSTKNKLYLETFPGGASGKEPACQCRLDLRLTSSIPGSGRFPGEGNGNPLQYPCLENPRDRGAWQATVHGVTRSWTWLKQLSTAWHGKETRGLPWWLSGKESTCPCRRQVWSLGRKDPLEKEKTTQSSILARKIPWTEEPGWLRPMGSQRVGQDSACMQDVGQGEYFWVF